MSVGPLPAVSLPLVVFGGINCLCYPFPDHPHLPHRNQEGIQGGGTSEGEIFFVVKVAAGWIFFRRKREKQKAALQELLLFTWSVFSTAWEESVNEENFPICFIFPQNWKKFGNSEFDAPGPNVATTTVSDDVFMTFITSKEVRLGGGGGTPRGAPKRA